MRETRDEEQTTKACAQIPDNLQIKYMWPNCLYVIIRKVWTTIIAKQIHHVLHEARVIYGAQSGY
jgi:hypothetical protein